MATTRVSSVRKTNPQGFMSLLSSAACEWFLIFLLFIDSAFSYLLMKFARYCELPTPCLFCSRLGKGKNESYSSLLCKNHQDEISSLVSCHLHGNLADVRGMCEECFTHFSRQNKLNSGSYRLLSGKLGLDFEKQGIQNQKKFPPTNSGLRICSCCNKTWGEKPNTQRLLQLTPIGFGASKANVRPPLPRAPVRSRLGRKDSLKKLRDKLTKPSSPKSTVKSGGNSLAHVGYSVLKVSSDSESEVPFSDDDDKSSVFGEKGKNDAIIRWNREPHIGSLLDQPTHFDMDMKNAYLAHGLEELNWDDPTHSRMSIEAHKVSEPVAQPVDSVPTISSFSILNEYFSASSNIVEDSNKNEENAESMSNDIDKPDARVDNEREVLENPVGPISVSDSSNVKEASDEINPTSTFTGVDNEKEDSDKSLSSSDSSIDEEINIVPEVEKISDQAESERVFNDKEITPVLPDHSINAIESSDIVASSMSNDINPTDRSVGTDNEKEGSDGQLSSNNSSTDEENSMPQVSSSDPVESKKVFNEEVNTSLVPEHSIDAIESSDNVSPSVSNDINLTERSNEEEISKVPLSATDSSKVEDLPQVSAECPRESPEKGDTSVIPEESINEIGDSNNEREVSNGSEEPVSSMPKASISEHDEPQRGGYASSSDGIHIQSVDGVNVSEIEVESVVYKLKQNMNELYKELEEERNAAAIAANQAMAMINRLQEEKAALHMEALQYLRMMDEQAEYDMEALEKANDLLSEREKELQDLEAELEYYRNSFQGNEVIIEDPSKKIVSKGKSVTTEDSESSKVDVTLNLEDEKVYLLQCLKKLERRMHQLSRKNAEHKMNKEGDQIKHKTEEDGLVMQNGSSLLYTSGGEMDLGNLENEISNLSNRLQALESDRDFLNHAFGVLQNGNEGLQLIQELVQELKELRRKEFQINTQLPLLHAMDHEEKVEMSA